MSKQRQQGKKEPVVKRASVLVEDCNECPHYQENFTCALSSSRRIKTSSIPKWCPLENAVPAATAKVILKPNHNAETDAALKAACDRIDRIISCAEKWRKAVDGLYEIKAEGFRMTKKYSIRRGALLMAELDLYKAVGIVK